MSRRSLLVVLSALALASLAWAADSRQELTHARADYRQAVTQHGAQSPEARKARQHLRATRRTFHAERRRGNNQ